MSGYFALDPRPFAPEDAPGARLLLIGTLGVTPYIDRAMEILELAERGAPPGVPGARDCTGRHRCGRRAIRTYRGDRGRCATSCGRGCPHRARKRCEPPDPAGSCRCRARRRVPFCSGRDAGRPSDWHHRVVASRCRLSRGGPATRFLPGGRCPSVLAFAIVMSSPPPRRWVPWRDSGGDPAPLTERSSRTRSGPDT